MNPHKNNKEIPDWKLERYLLEELPPEEMEHFRNEEKRNPSFRQRLEDLRKSDRDILERYPADWMTRRIFEKTDKPTRSRAGGKPRKFSWLWPLPALPVAAVFLLIALFPALFDKGNIDQIGIDLTQTTRIKGPGATLSLHRKTSSGSERLEDGDLSMEHDLILIQYHPAGKRYGVILSIDGRGTIIRHLPDEGRMAKPLEKDGAVPLDFAYELDDAPGLEKFYFVTSDSVFEISTVIRAALEMLRELPGAKPGSLDLPDHFDEFTFTLRKAENDV